MSASKARVFSDFEKSKVHVSIDVEELENSLKSEISELPSLSEDCCIWQVPKHIRKVSLHTPKIVSVGPLNHHRKELKDMEKDKLRCLDQFSGRTHLRMADFLRYINFKEAKIRSYYAESINYESEDFAKMILLDAVFLFELFLRYIPEFQRKDRVHANSELINNIVFDILLLENQLPIFILEELFVLAQPKLPEDFEGSSLCEFVGVFFEYYVGELIGIDNSLIERYYYEAKHFLDLLWLCLRPSNANDIKRLSPSEEALDITKLYKFGMKFEVVSTGKMLEITFNKSKRTLKIPKLIMSNMTLHLLGNLQIFESLCYRDSNHINDYIVMLNRLLSTEKDVELLIECGVIEKRILSSEEVSTFFQELGRDARVHRDNFHYSSLVKDLQDHCKPRRREWRAFFKHNYLTNPCVFGSVLVASAVFIFTLLQTIYAIK